MIMPYETPSSTFMSMPRMTAGMRRMGSTLASAADFHVIPRAEATKSRACCVGLNLRTGTSP